MSNQHPFPMHAAPSALADGEHSVPATGLTTREVAQQLGLAVRSVQLMVDRGELDAWKTAGGHRRISPASVQRWLATRGGASSMAADAVPTDPMPSLQPASTPPRIKVLLIEDSMHFQQVESLLIQRHFPEVVLHTASNAMVGLALCGAIRPHILIVDLVLPGVDGAALISSLRSHPEFEGIRPLVVTGLDAEQRQPYEYALQGLPVIEKHELTRQLPATLAQMLSTCIPS